MKLADVRPDEFSNQEHVSLKDLWHTIAARTHEFTVYYDWVKKKYPQIIGQTFSALPDLTEEQKAILGPRASKKFMNTYNRMQDAGKAFLKAGGKYSDFMPRSNEDDDYDVRF